MRGRPPKAIETHILNGNPGCRTLPEPIAVDHSVPEPPESLTDAEREVWAWLCSLLEPTGILGVTDAPRLEMLCRTWVQYQDAMETCRDEGMYYTTGKGEQVVAPWFKVLTKLQEQLSRDLSEFGFSPTARARLAHLGAGKNLKDSDPLRAMIDARESRN